MNLLDRAIALISPQLAFNRLRARLALAAYHDAAKPSRLRRARMRDGRGDAIVASDAQALRAFARDLDRNHDISHGAIDILVRYIVGANGIAVEPQPRRINGEIHDEFASESLALYRDWQRRPEVTWQHDWPAAQRMLARMWMRDGEGFAQRLTGPIAQLNHGTRVPYSLELIEADSVPMYHYDETRSIVQGIERNTWGRPTGYWVFKTDPSKLWSTTSVTDMKRIPAERMLHVKLAQRVLQARGLSLFAAVLTRLDDLKDYEESERIAAKVAASMAAFIKKGTPDLYVQKTDESGNVVPRDMKFRAGMIFDDLLPGEEIGTIDTNRPNPNLVNWRQGQLRAISAGIGPSYSSIARSYDGTYSAQRQELVETWGAYGVLQSEFTSAIVRPVYEDFLGAAILSGQLKVPKDLDLNSLDDALYIGPQMPWIDPLKEALSWKELEGACYASGPEIIRRRGQNPRDVVEQEANWQKLRAEKGLATNSDSIATPQTLSDNANNARRTAVEAAVRN